MWILDTLPIAYPLQKSGFLPTWTLYLVSGICKHCGWEHSDWVGCAQAEAFGLRTQVAVLLKAPEKPKFDRVAHMAWVREQKKKKRDSTAGG